MEDPTAATAAEDLDGAERDRSSAPAAGRARRLAAFIIDVALLSVVWIASGSLVAAVAAFALYTSVSMTVAGRTLGKALTGLRVQREDGGPLGWLSALLRSTVGYLASAFLLLGFLSVLRDPRGRAWHDFLFRSEVVQDPGRLSLDFLIHQLERWSAQMDEWRNRRLAFLDRLQGLWGLVTVPTRLIMSLLGGAERLVAAIAGLFGVTVASTGAIATAPAALTAILVAGASVATVDFVAPTAIPWVISTRPISSTYRTDFPGVVASPTRFDLEGDVLMVEVSFENRDDEEVGSAGARYYVTAELVDEKPPSQSFSPTRSGRTTFNVPAPGEVHTAWFRFEIDGARRRQFLLQVSGVKHPFEHLVAK